MKKMLAFSAGLWYTKFVVKLNAPLAQLDRVSGYGPEGQGFESLTACHNNSTNFDKKFVELFFIDTSALYKYNLIMKMIEFEWDENKNRINIEKHGVSFDEASTVFYDDYAILFDDPDHSDDEDRFLILGITRRENLCIVSHCYRGEDEIIRIISARKATKQEAKTYNNYRKG